MMAKNYEVAEGFIVAGRSAGETITAADVDNVDVLVESGRIIPEPSRASAKMKSDNADVRKEDDTNG
jgi:hypothetical protein